jgi:hypothetical protein
MLSTLLRGTFLLLLVTMIAAWAVSVVDASRAEPQYDPTEFWLA